MSIFLRHIYIYIHIINHINTYAPNAYVCRYVLVCVCVYVHIHIYTLYLCVDIHPQLDLTLGQSPDPRLLPDFGAHLPAGFRELGLQQQGRHPVRSLRSHQLDDGHVLVFWIRYEGMIWGPYCRGATRMDPIRMGLQITRSRSC